MYEGRTVLLIDSCSHAGFKSSISSFDKRSTTSLTHIDYQLKELFCISKSEQIKLSDILYLLQN